VLGTVARRERGGRGGEGERRGGENDGGKGGRDEGQGQNPSMTVPTAGPTYVTKTSSRIALAITLTPRMQTSR